MFRLLKKQKIKSPLILFCYLHCLKHKIIVNSSLLSSPVQMFYSFNINITCYSEYTRIPSKD